MSNIYTMFDMVAIADTHAEAIKIFSKRNFIRFEEISDYLVELAKRVEVCYNILIRTDSLDEFMEDMLDSGIIQIKKTKD